MDPIQKYRKYWQEYTRLNDVVGLLHWDSEVMMPEAARAERSEQIAQLSTWSHKMFVSEEFTRLIDDARNFIENSNSPNRHFLKRELEVLEKDRDRAKKLSPELVEKFSRLTNIAHGVWAEAKKNKKFSEFAPTLQEIVHLSREMAECYGYEKEPYDALLEGYETGTRSEELEKLFKHLKNSLIPLVNVAQYYPNPFKDGVPAEKQISFNTKLPSMIGLPANSHRLDTSLHPFSTSLGAKDKRITTRYDVKDPTSSIFGVLHETGHALYEYGLSDVAEYPNPLAAFTSLGIHESQSRLWENQVGRSRDFWEYYYPVMLKEYEIYQYDFTFEDFYKYINSVEKSRIRVEADQVTYNLHIILRFEIERELIARKIEIQDLPEIWNAKMKESFDLDIVNDAEGVLQDVHWSGGSFGYFPTYTLGNIYAAQLYHHFLQTHEDFLDGLRKRGDAGPLLNWLGRKIYSQGKFYDPKDLIKFATGEEPDSEYLVKYLKIKVKELEYV